MKNMKENRTYEDLLDLPHHVSSTRPRMSMIDRGAQFSPFAALTGYDGEIRETARLTEEKRELDEYTMAVLDERLRLLQEHLKEEPEVTVTYFQPDERKAGGAYQTVTGKLRKIDIHERWIRMDDGLQISIDQIAGLEGDFFEKSGYWEF